MQEDCSRPVLGTLAMVATMADGHGRSHIFQLLKGHRTWLSDYFEPPMPDMQHSVHASDISEGLKDAIHNMTQVS